MKKTPVRNPLHSAQGILLVSKVKLLVIGRKTKELVFVLFAISLVLFINGAIPFLMVPNTGITAWAMGFSQSMANGAFLDFYVHDFGIPKRAAISFGLVGVWPASLLIRAGLDPWNAHTAMSALWLLVAMFSAYRIALRFNATKLIALLGAVTWMTMPIIGRHTGYAMLSLGIALLSYYFLTAFKLFLIGSKNSELTVATISSYFIAALISVFMDGYTFMMFATGASILLFYSLLTRPNIRSKLFMVSLPVHIVCFAAASFLYLSYQGGSHFPNENLDFFRGWGLDLLFLVVPTTGVLWLPDLLGISVSRTDQLYFGDSSVWVSTFALPVLMLGVVAWSRARRRIEMSTGILLLSIFGFYMALGPSFKVNSVKPDDLQLIQTRTMAAEYAIAPTGNGWISENLPGFDAMRGSYRWSALGIFALWLLIVIYISTLDAHFTRIWLTLMVVLILFNLPNFENQLNQGMKSRALFQQIDQELIPDLRRYLNQNETVVFLPWKNDYLANYLAPRVGFRTFNIGGDKNLAIANAAWPREIITASGEINVDKIKSSLSLLIDGTVDVIVLPYFDLRWSSYSWPCAESGSTLDFPCPPDRKAQIQSVLNELYTLPYVDVVETDLFATIRLNPKFSNPDDYRTLIRELKGVTYPVEMKSEFSQVANRVLGRGWHALEINHVWSMSEANLRLPQPDECIKIKCEVKMSFWVFGGSPKRPVDVRFHSAEKEWVWSNQIQATSDKVFELNIPIQNEMVSQGVKISVPEATSPFQLTNSPDSRVLGIALIRIDLVKP